jgi:hypothetical protein
MNAPTERDTQAGNRGNAPCTVHAAQPARGTAHTAWPARGTEDITAAAHAHPCAFTWTHRRRGWQYEQATVRTTLWLYMKSCIGASTRLTTGSGTYAGSRSVMKYEFRERCARTAALASSGQRLAAAPRRSLYINRSQQHTSSTLPALGACAHRLRGDGADGAGSSSAVIGAGPRPAYCCAGCLRCMRAWGACSRGALGVHMLCLMPLHVALNFLKAKALTRARSMPCRDAKAHQSKQAPAPTAHIILLPSRRGAASGHSDIINVLHCDHTVCLHCCQVHQQHTISASYTAPVVARRMKQPVGLRIWMAILCAYCSSTSHPMNVNRQ